MTDEDPILVRPIGNNSTTTNWTPEIGPEASDFLKLVVPKASRDRICDDAVSILAKSVAPTSKAGQETGLIVGYVQSGKTMSFETVIALARDNGFQLVIVVAGTSTNLLEQSTGRLRRDLQLDSTQRGRCWIPFQNPGDQDIGKVDADVQAIRDALEDWRDTDTPDEFKGTILITVLKHYQRLQNLTTLLKVVGMEGVPTLIIDDEADQASLNTEIAQGDESTTYSRLMDLRQVLPNHTYLQYTATPQAPLLVSIIDSLSPNFVQVLEPGHEYVGGREFFEGDPRYIKVIPPKEVPTTSNPLSEPPDSLLGALRVFMIGVAAGICVGGNVGGNRSMLVHPSHKTVHHQEFYNWVRDIFESWKRTLNLPDDDPDRQEVIEDFREAYEDVASTVKDDLPPFKKIVRFLRLAFRRTRLLVVNAQQGKTPDVDWRSAYGWILVGGQAMDRGFTVEGLTVTYMPRGIGVGNADTVQQRARFFGYKRSYIGYCRVYLEQETLSAFQSYVAHEEDMRAQLKGVAAEGQPLNIWKRTFILDPDLRPCRNQVLEFDYMRGRFSNELVAPRVVLTSDDVIDNNYSVVSRFIQNLKFSPDEGHPDRTAIQRHEICRSVPLRTVIEMLLVQIRITATKDSQRNTGLLLQLNRALEDNPDEVCTIFRMSPTSQRRRGVDDNGEIANLFQGEAPVSPREQRGDIYPGDRKIHDGSTVTVQIHTLDLIQDNNIIKNNVPVIAVWVPERLGAAWVAQDQPGQVE